MKTMKPRQEEHKIIMQPNTSWDSTRSETVQENENLAAIKILAVVKQLVFQVAVLWT